MSEPITYVGIDAHKADLQVALLVPDATEPVVWTVTNEARAVDRLRRKLKRSGPGPIACCYEAALRLRAAEATGPGARPLRGDRAGAGAAEAGRAHQDGPAGRTDPLAKVAHRREPSDRGRAP